ncbi:MAG: DUF2868 domain-containing protein [Planctomycetota bacterium]|jgi:hypothetical protein
MTRPAASGVRADAGPLALDEHLLVEGVRAWEHLRPPAEAVDASAAEDEARRAGGDLARRLATRARRHPAAASVEAALERLGRVTGLVVAAGCLLALVAGAGSARAALGRPGDEPVNFYFVLGGLLGVQTLLLLGWIALMLRGPAALRAGSLGGLVLATGRGLARRVHHGPDQLAAVEAWADVHGRGAVARWTLSSITHALWSAFNIGCLALVVILLGARRYTFAWETTILSEATYVPLTRAVAFVPDRLGFAVPDDEQVRRSEWRGEGPLPEDAKGAWSGLLVGALVAYGLAPRALLLALAVGRGRRARRRLRLRLDRPEYLRLETVLMPDATRLGVVDADDAPTSAPAAGATPPHRARPPGPPAVVGLEIEPPGGRWPPPVDGVPWLDLGLVETGDDRRRVEHVLETSDTEPATLVTVCALTTSPDRGLAAFLARLVALVERAPALVLTGGQQLRDRGEARHLPTRVEDWRRLATSAGFAPDRVLEIDLDHLTAAGRGQLVALLGVTPAASAPTPARGIEAAFALVAEHAGRWSGAPDDAARAELHRAVAGVYAHESGTWGSWLSTDLGAVAGDARRRLEAGADRVRALLPEGLRLRPKWMAAGAAAGALGCVAAATLLMPAAITALPVWAAIGGAVATVLAPTRRGGEPETAADGDLGPAVRAAALFALVLELQGRDEATITRVLDETLGPDDDERRLGAAADVRAWLDEVRHRLDLSLAGGRPS